MSYERIAGEFDFAGKRREVNHRLARLSNLIPEYRGDIATGRPVDCFAGSFLELRGVSVWRQLLKPGGNLRKRQSRVRIDKAANPAPFSKVTSILLLITSMTR